MMVNQAPFLSFLDYLKFERRYSPHTVISYSTDLRDFFDFLEKQFGSTEFRDINHGMIRSWLAFLKETGRTAKTINRKISSLRSFFKWLLKEKLVDHTPMTRVLAPKVGKRLPVFIKESDTLELMQTLSGSSENWKTLNAKMLLLTLYTTGMRVTELINLKEGQIDLPRSQVKVLGKGNKERILPIGRELITAIGQYLQSKKKEFDNPDNTLLVTEKGRKMYPKYAYLLVNKYLKEVKTLDKRSPHVLRHTFATHLMNGGADLNAVKELLGHSSLASTQVYTHTTIEKLKEVYKNAHPKA